MKTTALFSIFLSFQLFGESQIEIHIDLSADTLGTVTPFLLGANNPMTSIVDRADYDPLTGLFPELFISAVRETGVRNLRFPGGNASGSYFWKDGLGSIEERPGGFDGSSGYSKNELGAHYKHMFSWHFGQNPDGSENYARTVRNYLLGGSQWQYYDMKNPQQGQRVVKKNNWSVNAEISNGQPDQSFYVKYPPVDPDSFFLALCADVSWGTEWQQTDNHETRLQNHREHLDVLAHGQKTLGIWISEFNLVYRLYDRTGDTSNPWYAGRQLDFFRSFSGSGIVYCGLPYGYAEPGLQYRAPGNEHPFTAHRF
ncbi:hypothetical protein JW835_01225 [bacterium]|nr:hypothetical protein [bacterium]